MNTNKTLTNIPVYILIDTYAFLDYLDLFKILMKRQCKTKIWLTEPRNFQRKLLIDYQIPSIEIFGGSIKDAVDIFSRINSKGITISQDWMLSALTSSEDDNFYL